MILVLDYFTRQSTDADPLGSLGFGNARVLFLKHVTFGASD